MDEEWKKQNQISEEPPASGTDQPPQSVNSGQVRPPQPLPSQSPGATVAPGQSVQPQTPLPQQPIDTGFPGQTNAAQPSGYEALNSQDIYDQYTQKSQFSKKKIIVPIICLVLLVSVVVGGVSLTGKKDNNNSKQASENAGGQSQQAVQKTIAVPVDWQPVDTKLGFVVKAPANWTASVPTDSEFSGFKGTTLPISDPNRDPANSYGNYVSVGTESLNSSKSQADFEKAITDIDTLSSSLAAFGIDKSQIKISSSKLSINGKEWTQINSEIPGQFSSTIYFWVNDHVVFLSVLSDKQDTLDTLINDYMLPMTASVELK